MARKPARKIGEKKVVIYHHPKPVVRAKPSPRPSPASPKEKARTRAPAQAVEIRTVPPTPSTEAKAIAAPPSPVGSSVVLATNALLDSLFKEAGASGSLLDHPTGKSFTLSTGFAEGAVHTNHGLQVPLSGGYRVRHEAQLAGELEDGRLVYVDILDGHDSPERAKAFGYDALHLKESPRRVHACLVFIRSKSATLTQGQVEAIAHGYDYVFGIDEENVPLGINYAACRTEILNWIRRKGGG